MQNNISPLFIGVKPLSKMHDDLCKLVQNSAKKLCKIKHMEERNRILLKTKEWDLSQFDRIENPLPVRADETPKDAQKTRAEHGELTRGLGDFIRENGAVISRAFYALLVASSVAVVAYALYLIFGAVGAWLLSVNWQAVFDFIFTALFYVLGAILVFILIAETARNRRQRTRYTSDYKPAKSKRIIVIQKTIIEE